MQVIQWPRSEWPYFGWLVQTTSLKGHQLWSTNSVQVTMATNKPNGRLSSLFWTLNWLSGVVIKQSLFEATCPTCLVWSRWQYNTCNTASDWSTLVIISSMWLLFRHINCYLIITLSLISGPVCIIYLLGYKQRAATTFRKVSTKWDVLASHCQKSEHQNEQGNNWLLWVVLKCDCVE